MRSQDPRWLLGAQRGATAVVGVGEGLGAALARRFATDYRVALIARSAEVIEKVAREIRTNGGVAATHELAVRPFREKF
jgi:short-subunit dehydrogenase